ncbi:MAG TPA: hypothetical protein VHS31_08335 [Tepidisphaeraceae bacterium]|nr:hypothetical protein [Tepidisphaeraceae bacterium]
MTLTTPSNRDAATSNIQDQAGVLSAVDQNMPPRWRMLVLDGTNIVRSCGTNFSLGVAVLLGMATEALHHADDMLMVFDANTRYVLNHNLKLPQYTRVWLISTAITWCSAPAGPALTISFLRKLIIHVAPLSRMIYSETLAKPIPGWLTQTVRFITPC